jgi:hypothetical protein
MEEHVSKLEEKFSFFKKKPYKFQEGFCLIFGSDIRETKDVLEMVEDYRRLMWHAVRNGKKVTKEEIYLIRGDGVLFFRGSGNHHWPPRYEKSSISILVPIDFHKGWHLNNFGLWKKKDIRDFWKRIFIDETLNDYHIIRETAFYIAA